MILTSWFFLGESYWQREVLLTAIGSTYNVLAHSRTQKLHKELKVVACHLHNILTFFWLWVEACTCITMSLLCIINAQTTSVWPDVDAACSGPGKYALVAQYSVFHAVLGPIQQRNKYFPSGHKHRSEPFSTAGFNWSLNYLLGQHCNANSQQSTSVWRWEQHHDRTSNREQAQMWLVRKGRDRIDQFPDRTQSWGGQLSNVQACHLECCLSASWKVSCKGWFKDKQGVL